MKGALHQCPHSQILLNIENEGKATAQVARPQAPSDPNVQGNQKRRSADSVSERGSLTAAAASDDDNIIIIGIRSPAHGYRERDREWMW